MKKYLLALVFLLMSVVSVDALELLMFSSSKCSYCQNFIKEVVPEYDKTGYHKKLPLKIIDIDQPPPKWILNSFTSGGLYQLKVTATFVVWDH